MTNNKKDPQKKAPPWKGQQKITGGVKRLTASTSPLVRVRIKTLICLVRMKDPKHIDVSSPSTNKLKYKNGEKR